MPSHARSQVHRRAKHVSVPLDRGTVVKARASQGASIQAGGGIKNPLDERQPTARRGRSQEDRVTDRLDQSVTVGKGFGRDGCESDRQVCGTLVPVRLGQCRVAGKIDH
ncbi:hypothetical protein G5V59_19435 [Nocardioides sp. W3-2-3]|uniref:hypothetical protein n=1 Tax=Nocardioides convexus TaxID=2712224 RepID=UPI00241831D2|nr:hypothetical protein [Nocardioides convexus]NHA01292.1 hypothetical protein [Nocardioides convexus]